MVANPNLTGPPFVDGWALPAAGLNRAFSATGPGLNILAYGGNNTGTGDNTAALAAAIAVNPNRAIVYFPPGKYAFASQQTIAMPNVANVSVSILGAGPDVTELTWAAAAGGIAITYAHVMTSVHIRDLTLSVGVANGGTALSITGVTTVPGQYYFPPSDITNVTIRGADGFSATDYWTTGISATRVSWFNHNNVSICGPLPSVSASGSLYATNSGPTGYFLIASATALGIVHNFVGCNFNALTNGLLIAQYIQGVTVDQCNFTGGYVGIGVPGSQVGLDQLAVTGSQFNCYATGILDSTGLANLTAIGNLFIIPSTGAGIDLVGFLSNITGNTFNAATSSGTGISYGGSINSQAGSVASNVFWNLGVGIAITSSVSGLVVWPNACWGVTANITNAAAAGNNSIRGCGPFGTRPGILTTAVSAAASGTGGVIRLTVGSSAGFVNDANVDVRVVTGSATCNLVGVISIVDTTHVEILGSVFSATCTGSMTLLQ